LPYLLNLFQKHGIVLGVYIVAKKKGFPNERSAISIIIAAIRYGKWPTTYAELVLLRNRAKKERELYQEQVAEYSLSKKCSENIFSRLWLGENKKEPPSESPLAILACQTDEEIFRGLRELQNSGFVELTEDSVVIPTKAFFTLLSEGCQEQKHLFCETVSI